MYLSVYFLSFYVYIPENYHGMLLGYSSIKANDNKKDLARDYQLLRVQIRKIGRTHALPTIFIKSHFNLFCACSLARHFNKCSIRWINWNTKNQILLLLTFWLCYTLFLPPYSKCIKKLSNFHLRQQKIFWFLVLVFVSMQRIEQKFQKISCEIVECDQKYYLE